MTLNQTQEIAEELLMSSGKYCGAGARRAVPLHRVPADLADLAACLVLVLMLPGPLLGETQKAIVKDLHHRWAIRLRCPWQVAGYAEWAGSGKTRVRGRNFTGSGNPGISVASELFSRRFHVSIARSGCWRLEVTNCHLKIGT